MKKFKKVLLVLAILALLPIGVLAKDKVNVYMFKKEGCPHCANALTFLNGLDEEYQNYFNLITKDVSETGTNTLLKKIVNYFRINIKGVPFIVIGDKTFEGFNEETGEQLKTAIKEAYENETPDVVAPLMVIEKKNSSGVLWIILAIIAGVIFLGCMAKEKAEEMENEVVSKKRTTSQKANTNTASKKNVSQATTSKKRTVKK